MKKLLPFAGMVILGGSVGLIIASCGSDRASSPGSPSTASGPPMRIDSNPYVNPIKTEGSSPARIAGDGHYFGYVRATDAKARPQTLGFDVAQFFFGKSVQAAAEEDGAVADGEPVSNDHYERNADTQALTLKIAAGAEVTGSFPVTRLTIPAQAYARCKSGCTAVPVTLGDFFASFDQEHYGLTAANGPFWVTIRDGLVVRIDEQYFP